MIDTEKETIKPEAVEEKKTTTTEEVKEVEAESIEIDVRDLQNKLNSVSEFEAKLIAYGERLEALEKTKHRIRIYTNEQPKEIKAPLTPKEMVEAFLKN